MELGLTDQSRSRPGGSPPNPAAYPLEWSHERCRTAEPRDRVMTAGLVAVVPGVLLQDSVVANDRDAFPLLAETEGLAGVGESEQHQDEGVDDVVVHEEVVRRRQH